MNDVAREILGTETASAVAYAFDAMEVAEGLLDERYGGKANEPEGAFGLLCPRSEVFGARMPLLRPHMAEILDRMDEGRDTRPGTRAEALAALSEMFTHAPPKHLWYVASVIAFVDVFGEDRARDVFGGEDVRRALIDRDLREQVEIRTRLAKELADETRTTDGCPFGGVRLLNRGGAALIAEVFRVGCSLAGPGGHA